MSHIALDSRAFRVPMPRIRHERSASAKGGKIFTAAGPRWGLIESNWNWPHTYAQIPYLTLLPIQLQLQPPCAQLLSSPSILPAILVPHISISLSELLLLRRPFDPRAHAGPPCHLDLLSRALSPFPTPVTRSYVH